MTESKTPMQPKGSAELYEKARKMHQVVYKKPIWNKEKYTKKVGFQLRGIFGQEVWTFKDLDNTQLLHIIGVMENKIKKHPTIANRLSE